MSLSKTFWFKSMQAIWPADICIDLLTRDSSQITFVCQNRPRERSAMRASCVLNGGVNHASYDDYSTFGLYRVKNHFVIENVTLPFPQICSNETGQKNSEGLTVHLYETRKTSFLCGTWSSDITGGSSSHEPRSLHCKNCAFAHPITVRSSSPWRCIWQIRSQFTLYCSVFLPW